MNVRQQHEGSGVERFKLHCKAREMPDVQRMGNVVQNRAFEHGALRGLPLHVTAVATLLLCIDKVRLQLTHLLGLCVSARGSLPRKHPMLLQV